MEAIIHIVTTFLVESIFQKIILPIFKIIGLLGVVVIKVLTWQNQSITAIAKKYKNSSKPYIIGFGIVITFSYFLIQFLK